MDQHPTIAATLNEKFCRDMAVEAELSDELKTLDIELLGLVGGGDVIICW